MRRQDALGCAPTGAKEATGLTGTINSVRSGKWSDPATWGGRLPAATDTPFISPTHTIIYDLRQTTVAGCIISKGSTLTFDNARSGLLLSTANMVVEGILQMRPAAAIHIHTIRFINIDETKCQGGGMNVLHSDTGLWVMGAGQLDLAGANKTAWTRAAQAIPAGATTIPVGATKGWLPGDEIAITPTEPPTVGDPYTTGFEERSIKAVTPSSIIVSSGASRNHPRVNKQWTAEVMNLTRNVRIEGTEKGRAHLFIRSSKPQSILYTAFRYMGPRKDTKGSPATELIAGRYAMHFHYSNDGSRGSLVQGNVIRDTGNHSYVPHVSHGIQFIDNIAYNVTETAFWWDPGDPTHDVIYDHNIVANCKFIPRSIDMNAEGAPTFSSSGFALNTGDGNICRNNVVVAGGQGDYGNGGAYNWEAVINEGVWIFHDNMAHNNHNGLRVWQNSTRNHVIDDFIAYHNGVGLFHGAYANSYTYNGGFFYGNTLLIKAASTNSNRVRIENMIVDGAGIIDHGIEVIHSPLPGDKPVFIRNVTIRGCKVAAVLDSAAPEVHSTDLVQCTIEGAILLHKQAAAGETIRVQTIHGSPYQITQSGTTTIEPFAATNWGNGKGLKAEYYNGNDMAKPAMTRIDSNVSFTEWSTGVHYAITGNAYAVRWTGQVQAQFTEEHIFYLGSGGGHRLWVDNKLIIDHWAEHYPRLFKSPSILLKAGERYDIKLEYFNTDAGTGMGLLWSCPGLPIEYIPQSQLYA